MNDFNSINPLGPAARVALRHHVVQSLLKAIIRGKLPAGSRLIASRLSVQLGVSATPIREALVELEQSGVVELLHHRGALVKPFGRKEVRDFYAVRELLECAAVQSACGHVDHDLLHGLRGDLERILDSNGDHHARWVMDCLALDRRIHGMAVDHCSNKRLAAEIDRYHTVSETFRDLLGTDRAHHHEPILSLKDFLDAMLEHRAEAGAAPMGQHISRIGAMVEAVMFDENRNRPD